MTYGHPTTGGKETLNVASDDDDTYESDEEERSGRPPTRGNTTLPPLPDETEQEVRRYNFNRPLTNDNRDVAGMSTSHARVPLPDGSDDSKKGVRRAEESDAEEEEEKAPEPKRMKVAKQTTRGQHSRATGVAQPVCHSARLAAMRLAYAQAQAPYQQGQAAPVARKSKGKATAKAKTRDAKAGGNLTPKKIRCTHLKPFQGRRRAQQCKKFFLHRSDGSLYCHLHRPSQQGDGIGECDPAGGASGRGGDGGSGSAQGEGPENAADASSTGAQVDRRQVQGSQASGSQAAVI